MNEGILYANLCQRLCANDQRTKFLKDRGLKFRAHVNLFRGIENCDTRKTPVPVDDARLSRQAIVAARMNILSQDVRARLARKDELRLRASTGLVDLGEIDAEDYAPWEVRFTSCEDLFGQVNWLQAGGA